MVKQRSLHSNHTSILTQQIPRCFVTGSNMISAVIMSLLAMTFTHLSTASQPRCRCLPGQSCWDLVDWSALNISVAGRLSKSTDVMQACVIDPASAVCTIALNKSDDEFWLSAQPNGFMHTGFSFQCRM